MSLISKVRSVFSKKDIGLTSKEDRIFWKGFGAYGHREFTQVAAALRAGFVLSGNMGMMPVRVDGDDELGARVENLLNKRPNDLLTGVEFRELLTLHAVYTGAGRALIIRKSGTGEPLELIPLSPNWTSSGWVYENGQYVLPINIEDEGISGSFTRNDILEVTGPRWEMIQAIPVTNSCRQVLGLSSALQNRQARLSDSNAPYGVIIAKHGTGNDAISRLKESWSKQFGKSGIAVVDFDSDFRQLMQTPQDQQLVETMKFQIEEISRVYGVHPYFLMQTGGSGAQGAVGDVMLFHHMTGIGPWATRWEAAIDRSFFDSANLSCRLDESELMRTTPDVRAEIYAKALGSGGNKPWMTENEVRTGKSPFTLPEHESGNELAHNTGVSNET